MTVSFTLTLDWDTLVTKNAPSGVKTVDRALLDTAKGLLREFFKVERINQPMLVLSFLVAARFADPIVSLQPYQFARETGQEF